MTRWRLGPVAVALIFAASACSGSGDGKSPDGRVSTTSSSRLADPVAVAGVMSIGRFVTSIALVRISVASGSMERKTIPRGLPLGKRSFTAAPS